MNAIDMAAPITSAMIGPMKAAGIVAACRYLSNNPPKNLTAAEAAMLSRAGIKCVVVWEGQGDLYSSFTAAQGRSDAQDAIAQAMALRIPAGATIYFAVDFDANDSQIANGITDYFRAVKAEMAVSPYVGGVYGNGAVCSEMLDAGLAAMAWVWAGMGTNGTPAFMGSGRWSIQQHPTTQMFGASVDGDDVKEPYGGWLLAVTTPAFPIDIKDIQSRLAAAGFYHGPIDGDFGPQSYAAMRAYQAANPV